MRSLTPVSMMTKPKSEVEQMVQEALSKEKWNAPNSLLHNLAVRTLKDESARLEILPPCWKILEGSQKEWRRVLKALALLEALLKRASAAAIKDITDNSWKIKRWREEQIMEGGKDVASGIREKARFIVELCDDSELLNKERKKNHELTMRMNSARRAPEAEKENTNIMQKLPSVSGLKALTPRNSNKKDVEEPTGFHAITEADMEAAAAETTRDASGKRPEFKELRSRCEAIQQATGVSAARAMQLLKEADWDANRALYTAGQTQTRQPTAAAPAQNANEDSDSDDSDSDSDSSDDDTPVASKGARKGGKAMGKGWPQQQQAFAKGGYGPSSFGSAGPQDNKGFGKGAAGFNASFSQQQAGKGYSLATSKGDGKGSMMGKGSMDNAMGKGMMAGKGNVMGKGGMPHGSGGFQSKGGWGGPVPQAVW